VDVHNRGMAADLMQSGAAPNPNPVPQNPGLGCRLCNGVNAGERGYHPAASDGGIVGLVRRSSETFNPTESAPPGVRNVPGAV
jgi:hypothetical protein